MKFVAVEYHPQAYPAVEAAVLAALSDGAERVVLDLDSVAVLDSGALRGLILLLRRVRSAGGELALRSNRADVLRTLSVTALDRVFPILQPEAA
ncbi:MAG: STAS domain-containing protein [Candidatus Tumulicola sp.]